jgi:hypothetical protein
MRQGATCQAEEGFPVLQTFSSADYSLAVTSNRENRVRGSSGALPEFRVCSEPDESMRHSFDDQDPDRQRQSDHIGMIFTEKAANRPRVPAIQDDAQGC